ncbi:MAG: hypothetical protein A4E19_17970 [Nitrospira sp. SG-bin1]|nr:MAG: hypothetical protein A4E19_17970 [Nitrospira sp. SG-bin1]
MFNQMHIHDLKRELELAEQDARPQIVEKTKDTSDEVVYENKTSGTIRTDLKNGPETLCAESSERRPPVDLTAYMHDVPQEVGKVVSQDETKRTVELVSGTIRTDRK